METTVNTTPKKSKKKISDFIWLFVGITAFIVALMLLKFLMHQANLV